MITSPPYNVGLNYGVAYQDKKSVDEFKEINESWLKILYPVCKESSRFYVAVAESMIWWFKPMSESLGWTYGQMLVWCKTNISSPRKISGDWNYMTDWFLLFRKGKRGPMLNSGDSRTFNWFALATPQSNHKEKRIHPAQWPTKLMRLIISRTPGEIILDPFMGSGSALLSAKQLGRQAIGIELEERYCELAVKRLAQSVMDLSEKAT